MSRLKVGLVFVGLLAVMAISAAPALSFFEVEKGNTKFSGQVANSEITQGGVFVYSGKESVKCPPSSVGIEWKLSGQTSPTQQYQIKWGTACTAEINNEKLKATVKESELLVSSPEKGKAKYESLKGTNLNETEIKAGPCVIKVPVAGNKELGKTEQTSPSTTSFEETVLVNTTGITAEITKGTLCTLGPKTTTAELKGVEFKLKGQGQR